MRAISLVLVISCMLVGLKAERYLGHPVEWGLLVKWVGMGAPLATPNPGQEIDLTVWSNSFEEGVMIYFAVHGHGHF